MSRDTRREYLENSAAVPTPMEAMALWVAVWEAQTGKRVNKGKHNFSAPTVTILDGTYKGSTMGYDYAKAVNIPEEYILHNEELSYDNFAHKDWTPTVGGCLIPEGYGSMALSLFILPDAVDQPLIEARYDWRKGWEWGHTKVYILVRDETTSTGFRAETNDTSLYFAKDVVELAHKSTVLKLMELFHAARLSVAA